MKIAVIWSSPNQNGLTASAKDRIIAGVQQAGAETVDIHLNRKHIEHCRACGNGWGTCATKGVCALKDDFADVYDTLIEAAGALNVQRLETGFDMYY